MCECFIITNHARERFVERFSVVENRKIYSHLSECGGCERCTSLVWQLQEEVDNNRDSLDKIIYEKLHKAKETNIHHNNLVFMERMYNKYGYQKFRFLVYGDILFVVVDKKEGKVLVTCINAKKSVIGNYVRRPKYKKKEVVVV